MGGYVHPESLVSTAWLAQHLADPDLRVVDASYYLPMQNRSARAEYDQRHIPGAVFFDIDEIADTTSSLPHMLPSPEKFASRVRKLGLGDGNRIVIYDSQGLFSAARVWWEFRVFGHKDVAVLDGGLPKWQREGRAVEAGEPAAVPAVLYRPDFRAARLRGIGDMLRNLAAPAELVLDARPAGRFSGRVAEPRAGVRSGHIPGSTNLPATDLLNPDGTFRATDEVRARFAAAGVDGSQPVITSCGSGVTACILTLGLRIAGLAEGAVYDGSWTEWGGRADTPVEIDRA